MKDMSDWNNKLYKRYTGREGVVPLPLEESGEPPPGKFQSWGGLLRGGVRGGGGGGVDRLILGALKSAFYIILIDSERSLSTITVP